MASLYKGEKPSSVGGSAGLADVFKPDGDGLVNVVRDYQWTLTPSTARQEVPTITIEEFEVNETTIKRQLLFYTTGIRSFLGSEDILNPYEQLFPYDQPTGFTYVLPYFSETSLEVSTPQWASLDTLESAKTGAEKAGGIFGAEELVKGTIEFASGVAGAALALSYPKVGIMDRPKLWQSHDFRSYSVKFPLFNTVQNSQSRTPEWVRNRELCWLLVNQNLYNKRDFITGIPPVFYIVNIPGQHYSPASCVTNITIYNRGNIRQLTEPGTGNPCNVPDVYEVNITFTDLVIPSKNLLQTVNNTKVQARFKDQNVTTTRSTQDTATQTTPETPTTESTSTGSNESRIARRRVAANSTDTTVDSNQSRIVRRRTGSAT